MYRAIPEVSRICSMQERSRQYKLHLEALQKIKKQNPRQRALSAQSNPYHKTSLRGGSKREEQKRITYENQKMYNAILYRPSYINHYDFIAHERDHEHQVARMTQMRSGTYGFEDLSKTKKKQRSYADEFEQNAYKSQPISNENDENEEQHDEVQEKQEKTAPQKTAQKEKTNSSSITQPLKQQVKEDREEKKQKEEAQKKAQQEQEPVAEEKPQDSNEGGMSLKAHVDDALDDARENKQPEEAQQENPEEPGKIKGALIDKIENQ